MANQFMTIPETIQSRAVQRHSGELVLQTHHLSKRYASRVSVDDLNLEMRRGDILGFLGPNGAGKTTTIRMILGLIMPTQGSVTILGQNVSTARAQVLPYVGALIETPALYLSMSGRDNLRAFGLALGGVSEQRIDEVLQIVGLSARHKDRVRTYSLGMKQRLAIAVALLQDPDILLLDEPTNGLDPAGIVEMRDLMQRLSSEGKSVLISSHLLSEVQHICTRVAIIHQGKLIKETTMEDLTRSTGEFRVQLSHAQHALSLIRQQAWGTQAYIGADGALITRAPRNDSYELNVFLVRAGFAPETLAPAGQDLEQIFLQLTTATTGEK